jgi:hypothetical protein
MKILFLDVDGVLNSRESFQAHKEATGKPVHWPLEHLCPELIDRLNIIVEITGCKIVLSSSWRRACTLEDFRKWMKERGFLYSDSIIDATGRGHDLNGAEPNFDRGGEIRQWLNFHPEVQTYVVLDDDSYDIVGNGTVHTHKDNFVQTNFDVGLQTEQVDAAIKILIKRKPVRLLLEVSHPFATQADIDWYVDHFIKSVNEKQLTVSGTEFFLKREDTP